MNFNERALPKALSNIVNKNKNKWGRSPNSLTLLDYMD